MSAVVRVMCVARARLMILQGVRFRTMWWHPPAPCHLKVLNLSLARALAHSVRAALAGVLLLCSLFSFFFVVSWLCLAVSQ